VLRVALADALPGGLAGLTWALAWPLGVAAAVVVACGSSPHPVPGGLPKGDHGPLAKNNAPEEAYHLQTMVSMIQNPSVGAVEACKSMKIDAAGAPGMGTALVDNPMGDHTPMPTVDSRKIDRKGKMNIGFA
jgi:hypothetical protein